MPRRPPADLDAPPPGFEGFSRETFKFMHGLKKNNNKPWFEAHRDDYEMHVRHPMTALLAALSQEFEKQKIPAIATPKVSLFRIYRDIRFAKDKSPYKTHVGLWMPYEGGDKDSWTGFYFGMEPAAKGKGMHAFIGGGSHHPPSPMLKRIRAKIGTEYQALEKILNTSSFKAAFPQGMRGASLTRVPVGFAADHPAAERLKMKDFWAGHDLTDDQLLSDDLPQQIAKVCKAALPLVEFLANA
jgi:uncharacterized protein (TIGR02453 family)